MRKTPRIIGYVALFFFSFVFFLYLTFPYEVLKESVAAEISQMTGYRVQIGSLSPKLLIGLKANDLKIEPPAGKASLTFQRATVQLRILPFFIGKLGIKIGFESKGGELDVKTNFGLLKLLLKKSTVPSSLSFEADNFPIDDLTHFVFTTQASSPDTNPLLAPMLAKLGVTGRLNAVADFSLDADQPTQSSGAADIRLLNAMLQLNDPGLKVQDQKFSKALIKGTLENGTLVVDKASGFTSQELDLAMSGRVALKPVLPTSTLDLNIAIKLDKGMKDQYGFLIDALAGGSRNGSVTLRVAGSVGTPAVNAL